MDLELLGYHWNLLGETDPMWAILMDPNCRGNRWDKGEFFQTGQRDVSSALEKVIDLRFPLRRGRALDFGCGLGRLTQALACYFDEANGVDISPAMIRGAGDYNPYGDRCQFFVNERNDLQQFPDQHYDFVLSLLVLQHMRPEYVKSYVAEFVRVLAPGGLLLFQEPSTYCDQPLPLDDRPLSYRVGNRARRLVRRTRNRLGKFVHMDRKWGYDFSRITTPIHKPRHPNLPAANSHSCGPQVEPCGAEKQASDCPASNTAVIPQTEIHTIPKRELLAHIKSVGGRVLHVEPRNECSPHHKSFRYFVTK